MDKSLGIFQVSGLSIHVFLLKCKNMLFWRKMGLIEVLYQIKVQMVINWSGQLQLQITPKLEILTKVDF